MDSPTPVALFWMALKRLFADEAIPLAGNIAFRIVFSIFPFLIFLTSLAGFFGNEVLADKVVSFLLSVAPKGLVTPFDSEIHNILTVPRAGLLSLAVLITIWSAMGGVDSVRVCLNRAYDIAETRPVWLLYVQNVLFVIAAAVLMLALALLLVVLPIGLQILQSHAWQTFAALPQLDWLRLPTAVLLLAAGLLAAHRFLPNRRLPMRDMLPGVGLTLVVWVILAIGFSWFLANFNSFASTYASLSGLFAVMFFIYQAALVLIFGGEMNRVLSQIRNRQATPDRSGTA